MAFIRMVKSQSGSYDGIHVRLYMKDDVYEVDGEFMPHSLSEAFLEQGVAVQSDAPKKGPAGPSELKDPLQKGVPETREPPQKGNK